MKGISPSDFVSEIKKSRYYKYLFAVPFVLLLAVFFTDYIISISLIVFSMLLSILVKKTGAKQFGIEFFTFTMVAVALNFGSLLGGLTGLILLLFHVAIVQLKGGYLLWVIPSYFVAGLLVPFLSGYSIFIIGAVTIGALQSFFLLMTLLLSPKRAFTGFLPYAITNVMFNLALFKFLGPVLITTF